MSGNMGIFSGENFHLCLPFPLGSTHKKHFVPQRLPPKTLCSQDAYNISHQERGNNSTENDPICFIIDLN